MSQSIPYNDLEEGIRMTLRNVSSLIDTASLLFSNKRFLHSAVFSVLAIGEMAKAQLLKKNCDNHKDVPIAEWNRITRGSSAHLEKMKDYLKVLPRNVDEIRRHPEVTVDQIIDLIARYHAGLKLDVLYVSWDKRLNKWRWLQKMYSEKEQEKVSARVLNSAKKGYEKYPAP